jgi:hypothetical protein
MKVITLFTLLFLVSCSGKDEQFCTCLSVGEELNEYTQQFFEKTPSATEQDKVVEFKTAKKAACKDYQMMSGDLMRQKKAACEE